jgi:hypothetical protein
MILDTLDNYRLLQKRNIVSAKPGNSLSQSCTKGCMPDAELMSEIETSTPSHLRDK